MNKLLDRLKQVDPTTYKRAFDWLQNVVWEFIKDDPEGYFLEDGPYPLRDALLQACLQEVIVNRGWDYDISKNNSDIIIFNGKDEPDVFISHSECTAKSLLECYLEAMDDYEDYHSRK